MLTARQWLSTKHISVDALCVMALHDLATWLPLDLVSSFHPTALALPTVLSFLALVVTHI